MTTKIKRKNHTPLPWRFEQEAPHNFNVFAKAEATGKENNGADRSVAKIYTKPGNIDFIDKAVHCHTDLVNALLAAKEHFDSEHHAGIMEIINNALDKAGAN